MTLTRAADVLITDLDRFVRAAGSEQPEDAEQSEETEEPEQSEGLPVDPEGLKEEILAAAREQLDWDGSGGDPNASLAALEDALADVFDADVEIVFDGQGTLTLRVEGEEPVPLTPDYLGELLEELAKQGADASQEEPEGEQEDDGDHKDLPERGHVSDRQRKGRIGGHFDEGKVSRDPGGKDGGRFIKTGTSAAGAAAGAAKAAAKATAKGPANSGPGRPGGTGKGGPAPSALAKRAQGRGGRRVMAKAVSTAFSMGIGKRVRVLFNEDGTLAVGPGKKKMNSKQASALMFATWLAFGTAGGLLSVLGFPIVAGAAATVGQVALIMKLVKAVRNRKSK